MFPTIWHPEKGKITSIGKRPMVGKSLEKEEEG